MVSLINRYKTLSGIPLYQNTRRAGSISLDLGNQSSDFPSVRFVNDGHSHLISFKTYYCQYCKQIIHLKMYYRSTSL